eukprot:CAMPEP_0173251302 /NCGR_PEP_ID=MMETSP1142-20121109/20076_1 /TAXON_ID=483371 /ORGANISM="non described non described, Strain CCMP2298" /LENGTH=101 /DNA_ID=CAMNT_0014184179 /DNA_START=211 /DNA_END=516 /DNA_ORIENTATION=-
MPCCISHRRFASRTTAPAKLAADMLVSLPAAPVPSPYRLVQQEKISSAAMSACAPTLLPAMVLKLLLLCAFAYSVCSRELFAFSTDCTFRISSSGSFDPAS